MQARTTVTEQKRCELCQRAVMLTFHHLIPRKVHSRKRFQKQFDRTQLNQGVMLCKLCHRGIHKLYDEMTLATQFNKLEKLESDHKLQKHIRWVKKQKESVAK